MISGGLLFGNLIYRLFYEINTFSFFDLFGYNGLQGQ